MKSGADPSGEGEDGRSSARANTTAGVASGPDAQSPGFLQKREGGETSSLMFRWAHGQDKAKEQGRWGIVPVPMSPSEPLAQAELLISVLHTGEEPAQRS